jgi:glycosyltransferase involved in cell wall biosynthesis
MKVGVVIGPKDAPFSAPLQCQRSLLAAMRGLGTSLDLVPVEGSVPHGLDLLHVDNLPFNWWEYYRVWRAPKVVSHAHGNLLWVHPELTGKTLAQRTRMRTFSRLSRKHLNRVLCVSNYLRQTLISVGMDPERLDTVYNGIDPIFSERTPGHPPLSGPYILHVCKYQPKKNTVSLVEAFPAIRQEFPDVKLIIAGPGHMGAASGSAAEGMPGVRFLGKVSMKTLHDLYADAECFVFPTRHETFGLPVVEAMASGCPVITTRKASMPEVGGGAVEYCHGSPADIAATVIDVLREPLRRRTLRKKGKARARKFSWERAGKQVLRAYEEVLG